jgi:hypothetical protein
MLGSAVSDDPPVNIISCQRITAQKPEIKLKAFEHLSVVAKCW